MFLLSGRRILLSSVAGHNVEIKIAAKGGETFTVDGVAVEKSRFHTRDTSGTNLPFVLAGAVDGIRSAKDRLERLAHRS